MLRLFRALRPVEGWGWRAPADPALEAAARAWQGALPAGGPVTNAQYDALVGYFAAGVRAYRSPGAALVLYPGLPGTRPLRVEGLEGFARTAPLLAAWATTRGPAIPLPDGTAFDAADHVLAGIAAGTDPASPESWGAAGDLDQRIVEGADVAFALWLLRDTARHALPAAVLERALDWLAGLLGRRTYGGNWHLFPLMAGAVLEAFGRPPHPLAETHAHWIRAMAMGDGWFHEGHGGVPDLYNAWQMHHAIPLLARVAPAGPTADLLATLRDFAPGYAHLFSPQGFPLYGRSLCYRFAVAAPLVLAAALPEPPVAPGLARRAMDVSWAAFLREGGLWAGTVSQGPLGAARPELLENYCGRGSPLWSLRALIAAYLLPADHPFWSGPTEPLPVERGAFDLTLEGPGLRITGEPASGLVTLRFARNAGAAPPPLEPHGPLRRLAERLLRRPLRPSNYAAKYHAPAYGSDNALWR